MKKQLLTAVSLMGFLLLSACGGGGGASNTPENATFDNATFDKSKWK